MKRNRHMKERVSLMAYRRQERQPFRWLVAVIIFVLGMCVTFSEVSGAEGTPTPTVNQSTIASQCITSIAVEATPRHP